MWNKNRGKSGANLVTKGSLVTKKKLSESKDFKVATYMIKKRNKSGLIN